MFVTLSSTTGLTDCELTDRVFGFGVGQQAINQAARMLATARRIARRRREDGKIGNFLTQVESDMTKTSVVTDYGQSEIRLQDEMTRHGAPDTAGCTNQE